MVSSKLKLYISSLIGDKLLNVANIAHDKELDLRKKIIKISLSSGNNTVINYLETLFAKEAYPDNLLLFLQEKVAAGLDTKDIEDLFAKLVVINDYNLSISDQFLSIIGKSRIHLIKLLIKNGNYKYIPSYINQIGLYFPNQLGEIIPTIIKNYDGDIVHYIETIFNILKTTDQIDELINGKYTCADTLEARMFKYPGHTAVVANYCSYLSKYNPEKLAAFEEAFLDAALDFPNCILEYAGRAPTSNLRAVLVALCKLEDKIYLVRFTKMFPQFQKLIIMI